MTIDISILPPKERARYYRELAADARREAETATAGARNSYRMMAQRWEQLATDANREVDHKN